MKQKVVQFIYAKPEIAVVIMEDRENKNTFTNDLMTQLVEAFVKAENNPKCKVIILTGYSSYFLTGGTKKSLLSIQEGKINFSDAASNERNVYSLPLDCSLPVIAAMQGHAIGGGLALGLFSDFVLMSYESIYAANFMKYGFTPGFGATYIFKEKLGIVLAEDFLLTARTFHGSELAQRGIPFQIYKRNEVLNKAVELAQCLAEKPRKSLVLLKKHMTKEIRAKIPQVIEEELKMHDETFHLPEVKEKIMQSY